MGSVSKYSNTTVFNLLDSRTTSASVGEVTSQYTCISQSSYSSTDATIASMNKSIDEGVNKAINLGSFGYSGGGDGTVSFKSVYAFLPIPTQFPQFAVNTNWNEMDLGVYDKQMVASMGGEVNKVLGSTGPIDAISNTVSALATGGTNYAKMLIARKKRELTENIMAMGASGEEKQAAVNEFYKQAGRAINPNKQLYFQGMNFESFSLSFEIAPLTPEDNSNLQLYIKDLIKCVVPDVMKSSGQNYFSYPGYFKVTIKSNGKVLFQEDKLAITSVSCTPNNHTHADGNPISYNFTVGFKETVLRTRDNLTNGNTIFLQ